MGTLKRMRSGFFAVISAVFLLGTELGGLTTSHAARDLTLGQALELALQHSPVLKASRQDIRSAEAQRQIAMSAFLPKVEAIEAWTNTNNPAQSFGIQLNPGCRA